MTKSESLLSAPEGIVDIWKILGASVPGFSPVADKQGPVVTSPKPGRGTIDLGFGFRCQVLRDRCNDTSFRVAMQGWRKVFADRTEVGHASKVGSLINLSWIDLHYALESH